MKLTKSDIDNILEEVLECEDRSNNNKVSITLLGIRLMDLEITGRCSCENGIIVCPGCNGERKSVFGICAGCKGAGTRTCGKCNNE